MKPALAALAKQNAAYARRFPGDYAGRQPVHTVYGGAHLFKSDSAPKLGELALRALSRYAPDAKTFAFAIGLDERLSRKVYDRVVDKLKREPVEDFRIDFEDGYGNRPDAEEDGHAVSAALEVAKGLEENTLPPFIGIRIKTFSNELAQRSVRTMDIFLSTLVRQTKGHLPPWFCVTLPKIVHPGQAAALGQLLTTFEKKKALAANAIKVELMVETPQSIIGADGTAPLRAMVDALGARCTGAHFGTYDYTASCNITAAHQHMMHASCDFAKAVMQVTLAGTGVTMSDGATNVMPVGPHRANPGEYLSAEQDRENVEAVRRAWRLHYEHATHSLERVLSRLGPAPGPAADALRGRGRVFSLRPARGDRAAQELHREGRAGHARRRRVRRRGDRPGAPQLLPARAQLRRDHGRGGRGHGPDARGVREPVLP